MDSLPLVVQHLQTEVFSVAVAARASLEPITGAEGKEMTQNNDTMTCTREQTHKLQFRRAWVEENCSNSILHIITLHTSIPPQAETNQTSSDHFRIQRPTQRPGLASCIHSLPNIHAIEKKSVKRRDSWVLQSPVSSPKTTKTVETTHTPKQAKSVPEGRRVKKWRPQSQYTHP